MLCIMEVRHNQIKIMSSQPYHDMYAIYTKHWNTPTYNHIHIIIILRVKNVRLLQGYISQAEMVHLGAVIANTTTSSLQHF